VSDIVERLLAWDCHVGQQVISEITRLCAENAALLSLAHQYAEECGDCAGTRVCPDDEPCNECADIWAVIDKAEGINCRLRNKP
jgi:hypothetical protein